MGVGGILRAPVVRRAVLSRGCCARCGAKQNLTLHAKRSLRLPRGAPPASGGWEAYAHAQPIRFARLLRHVELLCWACHRVRHTMTGQPVYSRRLRRFEELLTEDNAS